MLVYDSVCIHVHVEGHKQQSSSIHKHCYNMHGKVPEDLLRHFVFLKKCRNKFDCLVHEMSFIKQLKPNLNVQSDSISGNVFDCVILFVHCLLY